MSAKSKSHSLGTSASVSAHGGHVATVSNTTLSAHSGNAEEKVTATCEHKCACCHGVEKEKFEPSKRRLRLYREVFICHCPDGQCPDEIPIAKGKKGKKAKCPTRTKVLQIASAHAETELVYNDGMRQAIGSEIIWTTIVEWMMIILHKSRRLTHHMNVFDPETSLLLASRRP